MKNPKKYRAMPKIAKSVFIRYGMTTAIFAFAMVLTLMDFRDDLAARVCFFMFSFFFALSILMLCIYYNNSYSVIEFDDVAMESKAFKRTRRKLVFNDIRQYGTFPLSRNDDGRMRIFMFFSTLPSITENAIEYAWLLRQKEVIIMESNAEFLDEIRPFLKKAEFIEVRTDYISGEDSRS